MESNERDRKFLDWLNNADQRIRQGHGALVAQELRRLRIGDVPRAHRAGFAQIAMRLSLYYWGLRALTRIVRPEDPLASPATALEKSVYAALLLRVGASSEGHAILRTIKDSRLPEVPLYLAQREVLCWRYHAAIPHFRRYLKSAGLTPYQVLVGKLNLAACYVADRRFNEAKVLLGPLIAELKALNLNLLAGNALELMGQLHLNTGNRPEAEACLLEALKLLGQSNRRYRLYVEKWLTVLGLMNLKDEAPQLPQSARSRLHAVIDQAKAVSDWETVRDCELHEACLFDDSQLLQKVAFGTPFQGYQARIRRLVPEFKPAKTWTLGFASAAATTIVELETIQDLSPLPLLLFKNLTRDFYKPISTGELHQRLYPDEYFNPLSSPQKIATLVQVLRAWFAAHALPLRIVARNREYRLEGDPGIGIILGRSPSAKAILPAKIRPLMEFRSDVFSVTDAAKRLQVTERQARRILNLPEHQAFVESRPLRRGRYRLKKTF